MSLLLLAAALLTWPTGAASRRLAELVGEPRQKRRIPKPSTVLVATTTGLGGGLVFGPGGAVAGVMAGAVTWKRCQARKQLQQRVTAVADLAETLRSFVAELRAGAHPIAATESVAKDAPLVGAEAMRAIASTARGSSAPIPEEFAALAHAWVLAQQHGLPLADVLAAVAEDLEQRTRFARQTQAKMAGPRATAAVLAALPVGGILLGEVMGASPLRVLTTGMGQVVLVLGVALVCAGVLWSARLTRQAVLP